MFKVSHSKMKTWRNCRRQYSYKYVERLQRKKKNRPLMFGSLIHDTLDMVLQGKSPEPIFDKCTAELKKMFKEERIAEGVENLVEEGRIILDLYRKYYKNDGLKYLAVEIPFEVELIDGIVLEGKIDAIVEDQRGDIWILERKTAKQIPEERVRASDIQSLIYRHVLPQLRIVKGRKVVQIPEPKGIIWDYVRSKVPSKPKLNKEKKDGTRELSQASIETVESVYRAALKEYGLDPADYQDMLDSLKGAEVNFFRRYPLPFSKRVLKEVMNDFTETVIEMRALHGISRSRNLSRDCSWCEFYNLCQADLHGHDRAQLLKYDYEAKSNEKNDSTNTQEGNP